MNVLLLIVDALRPDHLSGNGYKRNTSPQMDKVMKESSVFSNTYTTLPRTDPSVTSLLSGLYAHKHGVRLLANNTIDPQVTLLPEILKSHGYRTGFITPGHIPPSGHDRGFVDYDLLSWKVKNKLQRTLYKLTHPDNFLGMAQQRIDTAINWIKKHKKEKFFFYVHLNELHWPYVVPKPFDHQYDPHYKGKHTFSDLDGGAITKGDVIFGAHKLPPDEIQHAIAHYDGGVNYVDLHFGRLMKTLEQENLKDDTLVIVCSDHGEHLGEHNYYFQHGGSLYEQSIKCTLFMRGPKLPKQKFSNRVHLMDVMPTVLDLLDIPLVDSIDAESLLPLTQGKKQKRNVIFAEGIEEHFKQHKRIYMKGVKGKWRTMIKDNWKIIYIPHPKEDMFELYNLGKDPEEKNNLFSKEKKKAQEMKKAILDFVSKQSNEGDVKVEDLTEKSKRLLVKAGYLDDDVLKA